MPLPDLRGELSSGNLAGVPVDMPHSLNYTRSMDRPIAESAFYMTTTGVAYRRQEANRRQRHSPFL